MGRIKGHYEWDDDDLTPSQKKEGGLHQNLFDSEGSLKGSARFVPDDGTDPDPLVITETVYLPIEQRRKSREQEELEEAIAALVSHLIDRGISKAKPIVAQWYQETARPAFDAQRAKIAERRSRREVNKSTLGDVAIDPPEQELVQAPAMSRPIMSRAEAQARYIAALASRAYGDEQMRLVAGANIVELEGHNIAELGRSLAELPPAHVRSLLEKMVADPTMLSEGTLAELASILGRQDRPSLEQQVQHP